MLERKPTLYDTLGVARDAKLTDITRAYNRHRSELTRDTAPPDLKRTTLIRQAFETLSDEKRRAEYDASLVTPDRIHRSRMRGMWIGGIGVAITGSYLLFAKPLDPPAQLVRPAEAVLNEVSPAIGRVLAIDMSGRSTPVAVAFAIGEGVLVTSCANISPNAQLVLQVLPRTIPVRVASVDREVGLCRLSAEGIGGRALDPGPAAKSGDWIFAVKVNPAGAIYLEQAKVQRAALEQNVGVIETRTLGAAGSPLLDAQGRLVGASTDGSGRHVAVPATWIAEAREPRREPKPEPEPIVEVAPPSQPGAFIPPERREKLEKAFNPPPKIEDELAKMK